MSRIFLAEDAELEREVVIKVVWSHLVDETLIERFRQEVLHTARLQHPTIVSVYDVGTLTTTDRRALPYYVMPYVRGESLRSRLRHEGSVSVGLALRVLRNVLDALAYAHAHGVVHRDIKPENIFLSGSNAVLADFGVAKVASGPRASASLTSPGTAVGTPSYMAPEQLSGEDSADPRSDLYSIGVVTYEMLAGRLPWSGSTPSDMLASQARDNPVPLRGLRGDVPEALDDLVLRCLRWDMSRRPASAADALHTVDGLAVTPSTPTAVTIGSVPMLRRIDVRRKLRRWAIGAAVATGAAGLWWQLAPPGAPVGNIRIAVLRPELPGAPRARDPLNEQLFHELIASLRPVARLTILAELTVSELAQAGLGTMQIADSLAQMQFDSALVVVASPSPSGSYQLSVQLRRLRGGAPETVAGPLAIASFDSLGRDSVAQLVRTLAAQTAAHFGLVSRGGAAQTRQSDAWMTWRMGRDAYADRSPASILRAITLFEHAIDIDPQYPQAYADLAQALGLALFYHLDTKETPTQTTVRALRLAMRATTLAPDLAEAYTAIGYIGMFSGAPSAFVAEQYGRARELNPENPNSEIWYVGTLFGEGRYEEALARLEQLARDDPRSAAVRISLPLYSMPTRKFLSAIRYAMDARKLVPGVPFTHALELWARVLNGGPELAECSSLPAGPYLGARALCLERTGRKAAGKATLDTLLQYALRGPDRDATFDRSLYAGELALYFGAQGDFVAAEQRMRDAYHEAPNGTNLWLTRAGVFSDRLVALSDSLRADTWQRIWHEAGLSDDVRLKSRNGEPR